MRNWRPYVDFMNWYMKHWCFYTVVLAFIISGIVYSAAFALFDTWLTLDKLVPALFTASSVLFAMLLTTVGITNLAFGAVFGRFVETQDAKHFFGVLFGTIRTLGVYLLLLLIRLKLDSLPGYVDFLYLFILAFVVLLCVLSVHHLRLLVYVRNVYKD